MATGAYYGNPNIQRQGEKARQIAQQRNVSDIADPRTYGFMQGLFGTAPDQLGYSVFDDPATKQAAQQAAEVGFVGGGLLSSLPIVGPALRGYGRLAGQEITDVMSGFPPRSILGQLTPKPMMLDVYHGTPHTLPPTPRNILGEFDASKIGTGEGAQAYGYGIYTAEAPVVAKEYQQKLSSTGSAKNLVNQFGGLDEGLAEASRRVEQYKQLIANGGGGAMDRVKSLLQISEKNVEDLKAMKAGLPENKGNLYKVALPDEKIATMLDWDKPVSQQKNVMNALRQEAEQRVKDRLLVNIENDIRSQLPAQDMGNDYTALFGNQNIAINQDIQKQALARLNQFDLKPLVDQELDSFKTPDMNWGMSGRDFYELLSKRIGSQQQASSLLQSQGVAGIRYLDEGSRATTGKQTSNFVVFPGEEKNMTILERNDIPASQIEMLNYSDPFSNTIGSSIR